MLTLPWKLFMFPKRLLAIDVFGQIIKNTQLSYLTVNQQQHSSSEYLAHSSGDMLPLQSSWVQPHSAHFKKLNVASSNKYTLYRSFSKTRYDGSWINIIKFWLVHKGYWLFFPHPFIAHLFVLPLNRRPGCFVSNFFSTLIFTSSSFCWILVLFRCIIMGLFENVLSMLRQGINLFFGSRW